MYVLYVWYVPLANLSDSLCIINFEVKVNTLSAIQSDSP